MVSLTNQNGEKDKLNDTFRYFYIIKQTLIFVFVLLSEYKRNYLLLLDECQARLTGKSFMNLLINLRIPDVIVFITKYSLMIGFPRDYLLRNCSAVTWVSNNSCPI